jgi:DNA-binding NtrC family response regulator
MSWKKKLSSYTNNTSFVESTIKNLQSENKINDNFLTCLNQLTLEEIIACKLELAAKAAGGMLFGLPLWSAMPEIAKEALLKATLAACRTQADAAGFLGITRTRLLQLVNKYNLKNDKN